MLGALENPSDANKDLSLSSRPVGSATMDDFTRKHVEEYIYGA